MAGNFLISTLTTLCVPGIDYCGDHLLEYAHGTMCIRQYDTTLVDIAYHALSQSHPGSREFHSCPGDVYHPDFHHGRPTYFDISVCSTTQDSPISSSSSCAGVAAAAEELAKDERHQDVVDEAGCDFFPLLLKCLACGLHSLFRFCTPLLITPQLEVVLLLDWLVRTLFSSFQCSLWLNNARMILKCWVLQCGDTDFPFVDV